MLDETKKAGAVDRHGIGMVIDEIEAQKTQDKATLQGYGLEGP